MRGQVDIGQTQIDVPPPTALRHSALIQATPNTGRQMVHQRLGGKQVGSVSLPVIQEGKEQEQEEEEGLRKRGRWRDKKKRKRANNEKTQGV
jgi:hypothetical protein